MLRQKCLLIILFALGSPKAVIFYFKYTANQNPHRYHLDKRTDSFGKMLHITAGDTRFPNPKTKWFVRCA